MRTRQGQQRGSGEGIRRHRSLAALMAVMAASVIVQGTPALAAGSNPNESVDTSLSATALAQTLVGPGVEIDNVQFSGAPHARGTFLFADAAVVGTGQGVILSSGDARDVVGPNTSDSFSTDWTNPGDPDLDTLSGYPTFDAVVLEFDFTPSANQVSFQYAFASDEYSEYVNTPFNDVFAFFINGVNCALVRQTAGDPTSPFVPVAVNNINDSNPTQDPPPPPVRPDLFRRNDFDPNGPSMLDLEQDGITRVITCQSAVEPDVTNHMKLAIADASDGVWDSAVFIAAGSLVSNENPIADLGLVPSRGTAPLEVTATIEGEDPNDLPLTYTLDWGDGSSTTGAALPDLTATATHTYVYGGEFIVTLTVSNGTLSGTDREDVDVIGPAGPTPTPTPTSGDPTATPTPTPTTTVGPTPVPVLDHFTCYGATAAKGSTKFVKREGVGLTDALGSSTATVKKPRYLCAPTDKLGEDPTAPSHPEHLEGYTIRRDEPFVPRTNVEVVDQLNPAGLRVDVKKPAQLLVPSVTATGGATPPVPGSFIVDHFQCYTVALTKGETRFTPVPAVTLEDEYGPMTADVQKLKLLCAPVDKNGEAPAAPQHAAHLACYQVKQVDAVKFAKVPGIAVANQFGSETLDAKKPALLCVPASRAS